MSKPLIVSLASGSKANCTLVSDGKTHILIDFGLSCRKVKQSLKDYGLDLSDVSAVFITHEHCDHVAGLPTFFKNYDVPVYITEPSYLDYIRGKGFEFRSRFTVVSETFSVSVDKIRVCSMPVRHDSAACVAYKLSGNGISLGICTDIGSPTEELFAFFKDCGCVITESNYDEKMLRCGIYPQELKYRIMSQSGHTSNDDCARFVARLAKNGVKNVLLAHISPENNTPELAVYVTAEALRDNGVSLDFLAAAPRDGAIAFPPVVND